VYNKKLRTYEVKKGGWLTSVKRTAPGSDNIPYWVFKQCAVELTGVIVNFINKTVNIGKPPSA